jgi:hypothetical protein
MKLSGIVASLVLAIAFINCPPPDAAAGQPEGVVHVRNGAEPAEPVRHLRLEEIWRAGGEDDDVLFGLITRVVEDPDGNLLVLDGQLSQVHVYDREGRHLRTLFGEGDGPGEVRGPRDLVLLPGGRVGAVQEMPGRIVLVDAMNNPAGSIGIGGPGVSHGGFCQTFSAMSGGDVLLVAGFVQNMGETPGSMVQTSFLSRFDEQGRELAGCCRVDNTIVFENFTFDERRHLASFWWNAAVAADGTAYAAPYLDRYEIHQFGPDGALRRVITREAEPWARTAAEKDAFVATVRAIYRDVPIRIDVEPADSEPMIATMHRGVRVHDDGTLWVLPTRGTRDQEPGVLATFDVFSPSGEFVRQAAVQFPGDPRHDAVFLLRNDRAVVVRGFVDAGLAQFTGGSVDAERDGGEPAVMEVVLCRVL